MTSLKVTILQLCQRNRTSQSIKAMDEEMGSLRENDTWELVKCPEDKRIINNKWVFRVKTKSNSDLERYKARLVIKGCSQMWVDYDETFSPVARFYTERILLSVAAVKKWIMMHFDVTTVFLYRYLKEEVYMQQPEGYDDNFDRMCNVGAYMV